MELIILNDKFENVALVDTYESLIWTDRYSEAGDFELHTYASQEMLDTYIQDYYIYNRSSEHLMIIESVEIESNVEDGDKLNIEGRSLESILDRRIVWSQTTFNNKNLQDAVEQLLNDAIINPAIADRKLSNFVFQKSDDEEITKLNITAQYTGDNLYEVIIDICNTNDLGFKIVLNDNNQFVFSLYKGVDRSYAQDLRPYVVFSPKFENIINSNYLESKKSLKNVTLVAGEGEGTDRKTATVGSASGLDRRELYTDARDISSENNGVTIDSASYTILLQTRGNEKLSENKTTKTFDGEVEATILFKYGEDFKMGDIVQLVNEYSIEHTTRIVEMVMSESSDESTMYPTFEVIDSEEATK